MFDKMHRYRDKRKKLIQLHVPEASNLLISTENLLMCTAIMKNEMKIQ